MIIRKYKEEDIPIIDEMGRNLHTNYSFKLDDFSDCLVICDNEVIMGYVVYSIIYDRAEIVDIYIKQIYRNKGYAKKLLNEVTNICIKSNCNNITLEVDEKNIPGTNLYKSLGFDIISTRKNYYENKTNGYLMKKDLR